MNYSLEKDALRILVVDDEPDMVNTLRDLISGEGDYVDVAYNGEEAVNVLEEQNYDLIISDLAMPQVDGLDIIKKVKNRTPETEVIIITGYGTINSAVEAMRYGALNYLIKPVEPDEIIRYVDQVKTHLFHRNGDYNSERFHNIIGKSSAMKKIFRLIPRVSRPNVSVLIQGASGVGKELIAHAIHACSSRKDKRFIPIDCGALSDTLLESELFGHKQGAFTGSTSDRIGLIESANNGTLFLDEVGNSSPFLQSRLLRVIEEKKVRRVGENTLVPVDVRILAASNEDLKELVQQGRFRIDLYYRLCGFVLDIPPLRERREDIPLLVRYFLGESAKQYNELEKTLSADAMDYLIRYSWPGNVRELRIIIERAVALSEGQSIEKKDIIIDHQVVGQQDVSVSSMDDSLITMPFYAAVESYEKQYLQELIEYVEGNISHASQLSGASRKTIREKGKKYGLL